MDSRIYDHCVTIYEAMNKDAEPYDTGEGEDKSDAKIWEGSLVQLFISTDVGQPRYSTIVKHLTRMGCIYQARRGGGGSPSQWLLLTSPTPEAFVNAKGRPEDPRRRNPITQRLHDLNQRVLRLEEATGLIEQVEEAEASS